MSGPGRWSDLLPRILSAVVMVLVGLGAVVQGGLVFTALISLACGIMVWELARMLLPGRPGVALQLGLLTGLTFLAAMNLEPVFTAPLLLAPALVGFGQMGKRRVLYTVYAVFIVLAGFGMILVRNGLGFDWMIWLLVIVIASDVAGYFAGKSIGGAKLWPRVSPNKTWSGTIVGWVGAALVGFFFGSDIGVGAALVIPSILLAMAAQVGDIAESAVKRSAGIKDSSNLIPGHGGLLDRFDGMLGASVFVLVFGQLMGLPTGVM
ncbi:MAG: phosphatidate cytidylyltransferase [Paracoccaceae bacterium]|jgi:phosphatidate cytidylyltransferase